MRDSGPSVGHPSQTPQETSKLQESEQTVQPGHSPLTCELLALGEELTEVLDYVDVEENNPGVPDPEITQVVAHIPQANAFADVEMQESCPPLSFECEVSRSGYDVNLVRSNPTEPGSTARLRRGKTRCWTELLPGPLELVGLVPMKTPAIQRTINVLGPYSPEDPYVSSQTDYFPALD